MDFKNHKKTLTADRTTAAFACDNRGVILSQILEYNKHL